MEYLPLYSSEQARRHNVVPGLTGWAQVNGRNAADWPARLAMDVWYVDNWSFWLDIKIILMTSWKVIKREGINQPGQATVEYFKGEQ
jgi:lipopolysaccharide/colanic/teichoic acid biosynthesis glycosyltransferase